MEDYIPTKRYFFASFMIKYSTGSLGITSCGYISKGPLFPTNDSLIDRRMPVKNGFGYKPSYKISLLSISEFKNEVDYLTFLGENILSINLD